MISITREQAFARWDTLPQVLCDTLFAEETTDFVQKVCRDEHISEEKISTVARLAGYVLFGFLHPEDLAAEIRDALSIDIRIATAIASAINQRIFVPLRTQIDAVYKPIISSMALGGIGPKILEEIRPIVPIGARGAGARMQSSAADVSGGKSVFGGNVSTPSPTMPVQAAPKSPLVPATSSAFINLQKTELGKIVLPPRPSESSGQRTIGGVPGIKTGIGSPAQTPTPTPTQVPPPMPVFMQTDSATRPIAKAPDFMTKSTDKFASLSSEPPKPISKPAVIEFGIPKPPAKSPIAPPPPSRSLASQLPKPMPVRPPEPPKSVAGSIPLPPRPPGK